MASVVMQAAAFPDEATARSAEAELVLLVERYAEFERTDPNPWREDRLPDVLAELGRRYGVEWPNLEDARFLIKGRVGEEAHVRRVDRVVFFWAPGFDLGGETLRKVLARMGALRCTAHPRLRVRATDPKARARELVTFLSEEGFAGQQRLTRDDRALKRALFSLTLEGDSARTHLIFNDAGMSDWAFVALLPQLEGEDPELTCSP